MAWRKRFSNWGGRARSFGRRFRTRTYSKGGFKARIGAPFIAGLAIGMTDYDKMVPAELKLVLACLPVQGPGIGTAKALAQGMILGDIIQSRTGINLAGGLGGTKPSNGYGV